MTCLKLMLSSANIREVETPDVRACVELLDGCREHRNIINKMLCRQLILQPRLSLSDRQAQPEKA